MVTFVLIVLAVALAVVLAMFWATGVFVPLSGPSTLHGAPRTPIEVTEVSASVSSVTLSWTPAATSTASGSVTTYEVLYTEGHSPATCGIWGSPIDVGTGLTATVMGLNEDTTYCFQVVAVYANGTDADSTWLTDAETLGPEGQATNAQDGATIVSTQAFSVTAGQLMLATVSSYGANFMTPLLTAQNGQTFALVTSYSNAANPALVTYVFDAVANLTTPDEVVTLTDSVASEYMLGIVSYSGYVGVATVGTWVTAVGIEDTANVSTVPGATLVACVGYVTDVGGASFSAGFTDATWAAATFNSRADQWYMIGGAASGINFGTVTRGLGGDTSLVLVALS